MLKIPTEEPVWTTDAAASLRLFLNSNAGQVLLQRLYWQRPTLPDLPTAPAAVLDASLRSAQAEAMGGYERALQDIIQLTVPPTQ